MKIQPMSFRLLGQTAQIHFQGLGPISRGEVAEHFLTRNGLRVAAEKQTVLGFYIAVAYEPGRKLWLDFIGVSRRHLRGGVGRKLMAHLETQAASAGFNEISLAVYSHNTRALAFYESLGYLAVETQNEPEKIRLTRKITPDGKVNPAPFGLIRSRSPLARAKRVVLKIYVIAYLKLMNWKVAK